MFFIVVAHKLYCRCRKFARPALSLRTHQGSANPHESNPWSTLALHLIASNYSFASSFNRALQILCNYSDCLVISKSHELICASLATCLPHSYRAQHEKWTWNVTMGVTRKDGELSKWRNLCVEINFHWSTEHDAIIYSYQAVISPAAGASRDSLTFWLISVTQTLSPMVILTILHNTAIRLLLLLF